MTRLTLLFIDSTKKLNWNFFPTPHESHPAGQKGFLVEGIFTNCLLQDHSQILCCVEIRTLC